MYLETIDSPEDVKALDRTALPQLCDELRAAMVEHASITGTHLASSLGACELMVALHYVFDSPRDRLVFDVSHQVAAHKMLTGRKDAFLAEEHQNDLSTFTNIHESEHDLFTVGHSSTSVSLACGLAMARDIKGETYDVVAFIGDGALSGGEAFAGLNNAIEVEGGLIVVVNDNDHSIAENHGGLYEDLRALRASDGAEPLNYFKALGLEYRYVEDGNDVNAVIDALQGLKGTDSHVVLHVHTTKGHGYEPAETDPETWHHAGTFDPQTGKINVPHLSNYSQITGEHLMRLMDANPNIVTVTAAMPLLLGFPKGRRLLAGRQFVDVGIAEDHAMTLCAALAREGLRPVFGLYAAFLHRAHDQLVHDVCLNGLPVTLLLFGTSAWGEKDATHLGLDDLGTLLPSPGLLTLAPTGVEEYLAMLDWATSQTERPVAIRVPGAPPTMPGAPLAPRNLSGGWGWQIVRMGREVAILALGDFFPVGRALTEHLADTCGIRATLINPRSAIVDDVLLREAIRAHRVIVTIEDGFIQGGWGETVARHAAPSAAKVLCYGISNEFHDRVDPQTLLPQNGISIDAMTHDILGALA